MQPVIGIGARTAIDRNLEIARDQLLLEQPGAGIDDLQLEPRVVFLEPDVVNEGDMLNLHNGAGSFCRVIRPFAAWQAAE